MAKTHYFALCETLIHILKYFPPLMTIYSKTCVKRALKNRQNKVLNDKW